MNKRNAFIIAAIVAIAMAVGVYLWRFSSVAAPSVATQHNSEASGHDDHAAESNHSDESHVEKEAGHENETADEHQEEAGHEGEAGHEEEKAGVTLTTAQLSDLGVKLATVGSTRYAKPMRFSGEIKFNIDQQYQVTAPLQARVEQIHAQLGQYVNKGQPLATLWVPELIGMQRDIEQNRAKLKLNQQEYQREQSLFRQGVTAQRDVQAAEYNSKLAQIELDASIAQLNGYQSSLSAANGRVVLRAPASGTISQRSISLGQMVSTSMPLYSISALESSWVEFAVPVSQADRIQAGMSVQIEAQGQRAVTGRVLQISSQADPQTRQLLVRAQVNEAAVWFKPNIWVDVTVGGESQVINLAVPANAIQSLNGQTVVFIAKNSAEAKDSYEFHPQPVSLTQLEGSDWVQVTAGLTAGQQYASSETFLLKSEIEKSEASHEH
jgi:cobalt-zinc-cadmium efflux system membrane fusion protein